MTGQKHRLSSTASRDQPDKKARKQRPCFSCQECRRLKMKCDRQVPCSNCVRRQRLAYCAGVQQTTSSPSPAPSPAQTSQTSRTLQTDATPIRPTQPPILPPPAPPAPSNDATTRTDTDDSDKSTSYGTLVMSRGGRSKYLGPTAGSEWLKDVGQPHLPDTADTTTNTPSITRCPSPEVEPPQPTVPAPINLSPIAFPINASAAQIRTRDLLAHLPPADEAWALVESYYRYCAWHHDVAPKPRFQETFARVYSFVTPGTTPTAPINFQEVALVFMIMSKGTDYNIEMPADDPSAEEWQHLSEMALVKGNFLSNNTLAGVQTLHIMAHKNFQSDKGRHDDKAWLLWGLAMRMMQAMGLHRDGARWNLPPDIVEERRKVFWEVNAADIFQAHCFSRPATLHPDHCDTEFPSEPRVVPSEKGYFELRFELAQISYEILDMAMKARRPPYSEVTSLDQKLRTYEQSLPYYIRCRSALVAMVSRYPHPVDAIAATPEPTRRAGAGAMPLAFQQSNLALNLCETVINLHRPYYAKALYDDTDAMDKSIYAPSFYAVIERCAMILALVADIHARYPAISTRQWNFWYHVFGSALCLGTLVLKHPTHAMAHFVLLQIDRAIALFTSLVQNGANTPRYQRNLQWLHKLRARAAAKKARAEEQPDAGRAAITDQGQDDKDIELIGWRTRLIRQADQQQQQQTVVTIASPVHAPLTNTSTTLTTTTDTAAGDDVLREFWDPITLHDFDFDFGMNGSTSNQDPQQGQQQNGQPLLNPGVSWWEWEYGNARTSL